MEGRIRIGACVRAGSFGKTPRIPQCADERELDNGGIVCPRVGAEGRREGKDSGVLSAGWGRLIILRRPSHHVHVGAEQASEASLRRPGFGCAAPSMHGPAPRSHPHSFLPSAVKFGASDEGVRECALKSGAAQARCTRLLCPGVDIMRRYGIRADTIYYLRLSRIYGWFSCEDALTPGEERAVKRACAACAAPDLDARRR